MSVSTVRYLSTSGLDTVMMCDNSRLYTKRKTTHAGFSNQTEYWYCRSRQCPGSVNVKNGSVHRLTNHKPTCDQSQAIEKLLFYEAMAKMCRDNVDLPYIQIYHSMQKAFPNAVEKIKFTDVRRSMSHWRYPHINRLPRTLLELDDLMKIPYYYKEFGTMDIDSTQENTDNELYAGAFTIDTISKNEPVKSVLMAFKNSTILKMIRGRVLRLGGDGTFSIRSRQRKGAKQYFDGVQQIYSVHVIINGKFYNIATFILQHSTADVMKKIFSLIDEWLQTGSIQTTIKSYMSDYECASRLILQEVWPDCQILGCSVHFQRAIFRFGRKCGLYSNKNMAYEKHLLNQVYGLCFVPETNMQAAYLHLQKQAVGELAQFGEKLLNYLRRNWLNKNISVANEDVRVNNGCEIFHYSIQRTHSWMRNNILDFLTLVRKIHTKSALEFTQWLSIQTSKKQQRMEEMHTRMQRNLRINIEVMGEQEAVAKFLSETLNFTKKVQHFFDNVNPTTNYDDQRNDT